MARDSLDHERANAGAGESPAPIRRVAVVGEGAAVLEPELRAIGFEIVSANAKLGMVVAYGGDGSLIGADREFPFIPKLAIRRNNDFLKCPRHSNAAVFRRVFEGDAEVTLLPRLKAEFGKQSIYAINDIVFHNAKATSGVRYYIAIDGRQYSGEVIGDGIVVATPFGSSAYYRSITNSVFRVGIGLAFNNSTEALNHLVLASESVIDIEVTRGPAIILGDNAALRETLEAGDKLQIRCSSQTSEIRELSTVLCHDCREKATGRPAGWRHV